MRGGKEINGNRKVEQRMQKGKKPNRKNLHAVRKGGVRREKWERFPEKSSEVGPRTRKNEKKVDFTGQKTSAISRKIARNRVRNWEKWEKRRFWSEKRGWGGGEKMGFTADFANAMKWQNGCK